MFLAGPPKPDRSLVRGQTKDGLPVLQDWGLGAVLTTLPRKKKSRYRNFKRTQML